MKSFFSDNGCFVISGKGDIMKFLQTSLLNSYDLTFLEANYIAKLPALYYQSPMALAIDILPFILLKSTLAPPFSILSFSFSFPGL